MIRFTCDYQEGAHPQVLEKLVATNLEQHAGYGEDEYCDQAARLIRNHCNAPQAAVHFIVGGTLANLLVISSILRPHQGVLAAESGHISVHETGAVEATGHKVITLPATEGKITAEQVRAYHQQHWAEPTHEHIVQPGMVYISHPTELGTLYSKAELRALSATCCELGLPLFVDGARLAYGLASPQADVDLEDLAALTDVFYIGGTKCGALFGEAVVIANPALQKDFRYLIKQRGAMLAKGRLLGLQFIALMENGLYEEIGAHALGLAQRIDAACRQHGFAMLADTVTNQVFPILPLDAIDRLAKKYVFEVWQKVDKQHSAVRFVTDWATESHIVDQFVADIAAL